MWTSLQISGFGYFSHTRWCNLHRQTLAVEKCLTEELSDFQHGPVVGSHLSNKSVFHISALLELLRSTVSGVNVKWKHLEATTGGRPHRLTEWDRTVLKRLASKKSSVLGCNTHNRVPNCLWKQRQHKELFVGRFMKWVFMGEQPHTSLRSPCAMPSGGWSGVKLPVIGLWSSGNVFSRVMNYASPSGSPTNKRAQS